MSFKLVKIKIWNIASELSDEWKLVQELSPRGGRRFCRLKEEKILMKKNLHYLQCVSTFGSPNPGIN